MIRWSLQADGRYLPAKLFFVGDYKWQICFQRIRKVCFLSTFLGDSSAGIYFTCHLHCKLGIPTTSLHEINSTLLVSRIACRKSLTRNWKAQQQRRHTISHSMDAEPRRLCSSTDDSNPHFSTAHSPFGNVDPGPPDLIQRSHQAQETATCDTTPQTPAATTPDQASSLKDTKSKQPFHPRRRKSSTVTALLLKKEAALASSESHSMVFEDGVEWIAKTPLNVTKETQDRLKSEVATLLFLQKLENFPAPKVY